MRVRTTLPRTEESGRPAPSARLLASAISSQQIEGLYLNPQASAEFRQVEAGTLSLSDLRARLLGRYRRSSSAG